MDVILLETFGYDTEGLLMGEKANGKMGMFEEKCIINKRLKCKSIRGQERGVLSIPFPLQFYLITSPTTFCF